MFCVFCIFFIFYLVFMIHINFKKELAKILFFPILSFVILIGLFLLLIKIPFIIHWGVIELENSYDVWWIIATIIISIWTLWVCIMTLISCLRINNLDLGRKKKISLMFVFSFIRILMVVFSPIVCMKIWDFMI